MGWRGWDCVRREVERERDGKGGGGGKKRKKGEGLGGKRGGWRLGGGIRWGEVVTREERGI